MTDHATTVLPEVAPKRSWISILQLIFSIAAFLGFLGAGIWALGNSQAGLSGNLALTQQGGLLTVLGLASLLFAIISLISLITSALQLANRAQPRWLTGKMVWLKWLDLLLVAVLVAGYLTSRTANSTGLGMPILTVLGVLLPVIWLLRIGAKNQWGKHPQRSSGLFTFSFGFSTWLILILELIVVIVMVIIFQALSSGDPGLQQLLNQLIQALQNSTSNPDQLMPALQSLLLNPLVTSLLIVMVSVLVPFIEELFKTLGVWFLIGRKISPAEGYVAGMVSGAGFALVEGLLNASMVSFPVAGLEWLAFVFGRAGGSLIHIFNCGLVGWMLARSWQDHHYGRLVVAYLLAMLIHGLWNGFAVFAGVTPTIQGATAASSNYYLPLGIVFILVFISFFSISDRIHRESLSSSSV